MRLERYLIPAFIASVLFAVGVFTFSYFDQQEELPQFKNLKTNLTAPTKDSPNTTKSVQDPNVDTKSSLYQISNTNDEKKKKNKSPFLPFTEQVKERDKFYQRNRMKIPPLVGQRYRLITRDDIDGLMVANPNAKYHFTISIYPGGTDYRTLLEPLTKLHNLILGDERQLDVKHPDANVKILNAFVFDERDFSHLFLFVEHPWTRKLVLMQFYSTNYNSKTEELMNQIFESLQFN